MSLAQNLLDAGFTSLLGTNGEALTYGSSTVTAVVNRNLEFSTRFNLTPGMPSADTAMVELLASALASQPQIGQHFTDANNNRLRIIRWKRINNWYRIECSITK